MSYPQNYDDYPVQFNYPPLTKKEEDRKQAESIKGSLDLLTEGIRKKNGQVYGTGYITLVQDAPTTHLNFVKDTYNQNVPSGTVYATPGKLLYALKLVNVGPGVLGYSINMFINDTGTAILLPGSSESFSAERPIYQEINIRALGANTTCCIIFQD